MDDVRDKELIKTPSKSTTALLLAIVLATLLPLLQMQFLVGPMVNAILFIVTVLLGPKKAYWVALIPSPIALAVGQLPFILLPMLPFIMLGNCLMVFVFSKFFKKNYWSGVALGSGAKFLLLFGVSQLFIATTVIKSGFASSVALMMSWPQLVTALAGGVIAWVILHVGKTHLQKMVE